MITVNLYFDTIVQNFQKNTYSRSCKIENLTKLQNNLKQPLKNYSTKMSPPFRC